MSARIPFIPGKTNYTRIVPLGDAVYQLFVRWNSRDDLGAWYIDFFEENGDPIATSVKVVLGTDLAVTCPHELFRKYRFHPVDTSGSGVDAGFDDIGESDAYQGRIHVMITAVSA